MSQVIESKVMNRAAYLADLSKFVHNQLAFTSINELKNRAQLLLTEQAIPSTRDEEWRFTDLSGLLSLKLSPAPLVKLEKEAILPLLLPEAEASRLVFVNGIYAANLSNVAAIPTEVFVGNLAQENLPANVLSYLGKQPGFEEVFTTLNTQGFEDVAIVYIPKNTVLETPIHLLFITVAEQSIIAQPRCLIVAEANSKATVVEHFASSQIGCPDLPTFHPYLTNSVTEITTEQNAELTHIRLQRESRDAFSIGKTAVSQARDSRYTCHALSLGGNISRHNLEIFQTGLGTMTKLNGLTMISGNQLADTHSLIALNHPQGTTDQLHKCIVADHAHAVFNGKVFVPKPAQLTNAAQLSRNLLLSPKARVDTKPQLEITADNVKCSHGATVSQLDADELFYLQSRGLDRQMSSHLLIDAFAGEMIQALPVESLKTMLSRCVSCRNND